MFTCIIKEKDVATLNELVHDIEEIAQEREARWFNCYIRGNDLVIALAGSATIFDFKDIQSLNSLRRLERAIIILKRTGRPVFTDQDIIRAIARRHRLELY